MRKLVDGIAQLPGAKLDFDAIAKHLLIDPEREVTQRHSVHVVCVWGSTYCMTARPLSGAICYDTGQVAGGTKQTEPSPERPHPLVGPEAVRPQNTETTLGDFVRSLNSTVFHTAPILPAYKITEDYTESRPDDSKQIMFMVGWDCIKPS